MPRKQKIAAKTSDSRNDVVVAVVRANHQLHRTERGHAIHDCEKKHHHHERASLNLPILTIPTSQTPAMADETTKADDYYKLTVVETGDPTSLSSHMYLVCLESAAAERTRLSPANPSNGSARGNHCRSQTPQAWRDMSDDRWAFE